MNESMIFSFSVSLVFLLGYDIWKKNFDLRTLYIRFFLFLVIFIYSCLTSSKAHADWEPCKNCYPFWNDDFEPYLEQYKIHFERVDNLYQIIIQINEKHAYDIDDVFVSGTCGAILATTASDARSRAIAIALAIAADYFKEKYYCHRALRRYAEDYRYEVFLMQKNKDQVVKNHKMCYMCEKVYDSDNYWGVPYYKYLEFWKSWWDDLDKKANHKPGCLHTQ